MAKKKKAVEDLSEYENAEGLSEYEPNPTDTDTPITKAAYLTERIGFLNEKILRDKASIQPVLIRIEIAEKLLEVLKTELRKEA